MLKRLENLKKQEDEEENSNKHEIDSSERLQVFLVFKNRRLELEYLQKQIGGIRLTISCAFIFLILFQYSFTATQGPPHWTFFMLFTMSLPYLFLSVIGFIFVWFPETLEVLELAMFVLSTITLCGFSFRSCHLNEINGMVIFQFGYTLWLGIRFFYVLIGVVVNWIFHLGCRIIFQIWFQNENYSGDMQYFFCIILQSLCTILLILMNYGVETINRQSFLKSKDLQLEKRKLKTKKKRLDLLRSNVVPQGFLKSIRMIEKENLEERIILNKNAKTVLIKSNLVNFSKFCSTMESGKIIFRVLNYHYKRFDILCQNLKLQKLKTIGDSFIAMQVFKDDEDVNFLPVIFFGLAMIHIVKNGNHSLQTNLKIRVGISYGEILLAYYRDNQNFDIFGEAYEKVVFLENTGNVGHVNVSKKIYEKTSHQFDYNLVYLEEIEEFDSRDSADGKKFQVKGLLDKISNEELRINFRKYVEINSLIARENSKAKLSLKTKTKIEQILFPLLSIDKSKKKKVGLNGLMDRPLSGSSNDDIELEDAEKKSQKIEDSKNSNISLLSNENTPAFSIFTNKNKKWYWSIFNSFIYNKKTGLIPLFQIFVPFKTEILFQNNSRQINSLGNMFGLLFSLFFSISHLICQLCEYQFHKFTTANVFTITLYVSIVIFLTLLLIEYINMKKVKSLFISFIVSMVALLLMVLINFLFRYPENYYGGWVYITLFATAHGLSLSMMYFFNYFFRLSMAIAYMIVNLYDSYRIKYNDMLFIDTVVIFIQIIIGSTILEAYSRSLFNKIILMNEIGEKCERENKEIHELVNQFLTKKIVDTNQKKDEVIYDDYTSAFIGFFKLLDIKNDIKRKIDFSNEENVKKISSLFAKFDEVLLLECGVKAVNCLNDSFFFIVVNDENVSNFHQMFEFIVFCVKESKKEGLEINIGLCEGNVRGGVLGHEKIVYDYLGDNINLSNTLCNISEKSGLVHCLKGNLDDFLECADFDYEQIHSDGKKTIKGQGEIESEYIQLKEIKYF